MNKTMLVVGLSLLFLTACSSWWPFKKDSPSVEVPPGNATPYFESSNPQDKALIRSLESKLGSKKEKEQYSKILPWLKNDQERIEFLKLTDLEERQRWIQDKKIWSRTKSISPQLAEMADAGDIALGMPADLVKKSWGEPQVVEVSGNPAYKNERWKYMKYIATPEGYKPEKRTVYFEGGKVVGWETD